ncbi:MAG: hypothetical protein DMG59_16170 [Acidobacteria bacterium]|nr:MAG: hypothetical protein DMG59_16170 [Acidobacteriota bacterium]
MVAHASPRPRPDHPQRRRHAPRMASNDVLEPAGAALPGGHAGDGADAAGGRSARDRLPAAYGPFLLKGSEMDERNFQYMFYGFLAAWLIVVVYVVLLALRERKLRRELDRVRKMLGK